MLNDYYKNVGLKGYFNRYGIWNGIKRGMFNAMPIHLVKDYEIKKVLWQKSASKYVRKYIKYKDENPEGLEFNCKKIPENPVWVFWNSGMDNAPDIVKACYKSLLKYSGGTVIVLDEHNIDEYVIFPNYIKKKVDNGNIPMAGYTDLMRFALLEHYGGTWIDSTVYLSGTILPSILNTDFFALRNTMMLVDNPVLYPAWFLHSKAGNKSIREIRNVAFAYWSKEQHVNEYLLPNLIITELIRGTDVENNMPYLSTDYSEYLIKCLGDEYSKEKLDWIFELTSIHKLSYKLDASIAKENTIYSKIVKLEG